MEEMKKNRSLKILTVVSSDHGSIEDYTRSGKKYLVNNQSILIDIRDHIKIFTQSPARNHMTDKIALL